MFIEITTEEGYKKIINISQIQSITPFKDESGGHIVLARDYFNVGEIEYNKVISLIRSKGLMF